MTVLRLRRDGLAWSDIGGETVLLDLETSAYFSAQDSGALLLNRLADGTSEAALVAALLDTYEVNEETARASVARFLAELDSKRLVERVDA